VDYASQRKKKAIIVGLSGGSGVLYGIRMLEYLRTVGIETDLILAPEAKASVIAETDYRPLQVEKLASRVHKMEGSSIPVRSTQSMIIVPTSAATLAAIASGKSNNSLVRTAAKTLREKNMLILVLGETPFTLSFIENMKKAALAGAVIVPAMPAFYGRPKTLDDIVNHLVGRILDLVGIENDLAKRWKGLTA
jgi:flavin prenyltransferase